MPHKDTNCRNKRAALNERFDFSSNSKSVAGCVSWCENCHTLLIRVCDQRGEKNTGHPRFRKENLQHTRPHCMLNCVVFIGCYLPILSQKFTQKTLHNALRPACKISAIYMSRIFAICFPVGLFRPKSMPREITFGMIINTT